MTGKDIPLITVIHTKGEQIWTTKRPKYELKTSKEIQRDQERLGRMVGSYYGTWCDKCCGVYPKFYTEDGFRDYGYYVCLVCGKESTHQPMPWQARDEWNNGRFVFIPSELNRQMTLDDYIEF